MKLWKQLVVSFVMAWVLPPLGLFFMELFGIMDIGWLAMFPVFSFVPDIFNTATIESAQVLAFNMLGILLLNWIIVFSVIFLFNFLRKKYHPC